MAATIRYKAGVSDPAKACREIREAIAVAASVWGEFVGDAGELVVTSLNDGAHRPESYHGKGQAVDLRTSNLPNDAARRTAARRLGARLGATVELPVSNPLKYLLNLWRPDRKGYRVLLEADHCHVEWRT